LGVVTTIAVVGVAIAIGYHFYSKTFDQQKPTWVQRATEEVNRMMTGVNGPKIASSIQVATHPTGSNPKLESFQVRQVGQDLSVRIDVNWHGGLTKTLYTTRVVWEFNHEHHIRPSITDDSAAVKAEPANLRSLDEYFRTECYAVLRTQLGD